jgi:3-oxoacyl-[acyl-carrier protein] reductase
MYMLNGKYAVVTGAAKGIGASIVERFLEEGVAGVALVARRREI